MSSTNSGQFDIIEIMSSDPVFSDATLELFNCFYCGHIDTRRVGEKREFCFDCAEKSPAQNKKEVSCECGAHKTLNPNLHSDWCPLA